LRAVDYGDYDKIITLATVEEGKLSARLRGVRKQSSKLRFAGGAFCFAEYILNGADGNYLVTNCSAVELFAPLYENIERMYAAYAVCEFLDKFSEGGEEIGALMSLALKSLKTLAYGSENSALVLDWFFVNALRICGYGMSFSVCARCSGDSKITGLSYKLGGGVCNACIDDTTALLHPAEINILRILSKSNCSDLRIMKFEDADVLGCLYALKGYLMYIYAKPASALEQFLNI